jgi:RNA polymerase primary sigma factor
MRQLKITKQVTNRETLSLDKYLHEISKVELISLDEEVQLAKQITQGDEKALEKLVSANLRFVVSVAKQYQNQGLSLPDLINEGNLGLIKAAQRFDETRGFKFISYAVWWIRQSILQSLAEQARIVRLPLNKIGSLNKINRTYSILEQQLERDPTAEEIANSLDMLPKDIKEIMRHSGRHISMDAPLGNSEDDSSLYDVLMTEDTNPPDKKLIKESIQKEIERAIFTLTFRESYVLRHYYGLNDLNPETLEEIGEALELTRERVRQIKERAIKRLKNTSRSKILRTYLGELNL